jgi:hypothetical protein
MTIDSGEFQTRLRTMLGLHSMELGDEELARMADRYPLCTGTERWDVRQYAGGGGMGAREFRVLRGTRTQHVYRSTERMQADAVGVALNAMEAEDTP